MQHPHRLLNVLAFSERASLTAALQQQLSELPWVGWQGLKTTLEPLAEALLQNNTDVLLLDWSKKQAAVLEWLKEHALKADCPFVVILLHQNDPPELLMQAVRLGAREVLEYPANAELLELALLRLHNLLDRAIQQAPNAGKASLPAEAFRQPCRVLSVFAAKGGAGASSVAVNTAHELRLMTKQEVLLLDMDQVFSNTALMLNLKPSHALGDLVSKPLGELTDETLQKILLHHESGLHLLAASKSILDDNELLPPELLQRLVQFARNHYAYVVIDLPSHTLDPYHQFFIEQADEVLLVSGLDVPGLVRTRQYLDLASQFIAEDKLKLLLNRWDLTAAYGMSNKSLEAEFGYPVYSRLSNNWELNVEANSLGKPYSQIKPTDPLVKDIQALTKQLAGLDEAEQSKANEKALQKTRSLGGLFDKWLGGNK